MEYDLGLNLPFQLKKKKTLCSQMAGAYHIFVAKYYRAGFAN